ncbi:MAG: hypothetical protein EP330_21950 [Deltaproteobacteria bacterium]|nr:MAG: hypothetical protein EP330_21950 [Deltaproteobacteria bacterium]
MHEPPRWATTAVLVVFGVIAAYDLATGLWLLLAPEPWWAHGPGTAWSALAGDPNAEGLFRRLGAMQLVLGAATLGWLWLGRRDPRVYDTMLAVYALCGGALAWTDQAFFADTPYLWAKRGVAVVSTAAMVGWYAARLRPGRGS